MSLTALTYEILLALADGDRHGYGILKEIEARGVGGDAPSTGAMYLALQRMEADGLIEEAPFPDDGEDRRRRYYRITQRGRDAGERESARLAELVATARARKLWAEGAT